MPRKFHADQGTNFKSKDVKNFCNSVGIEIIQLPVNDHRVTGCVELTIGSLENSGLSYAREENLQKGPRSVTIPKQCNA